MSSSSTLFEEKNSEVVDNPLNIKGFAFIEFSGPGAEHFHDTFTKLGFSRTRQCKANPIDVYQQNHIVFFYSQQPQGFAPEFAKAHGQSACAMGLQVDNAQQAFDTAVERGAKPFDPSLSGDKSFVIPAVYGVGDSLIYFVEDMPGLLEKGFTPHPQPKNVENKGFMFVDHLTNNVFEGTMDEWVDFYTNIFGFTKIQYFDIRGLKTGLNSFALKSPCRTFSIPINEGTEAKSQINEYLDEYKGPGIQHIALSTEDLLATLDRLEGVKTLDIAPTYYDEAFARVPNVTEDKAHIQRHQVLIDGDEEGYLLQIFTQNCFGPIFFEFIQRKNHHAFGEGNFGALFQSIERDQERRGVL